MRRTVGHDIEHWIRVPDGPAAYLACCDAGCARKWLSAHRHLHPAAEVVTQTVRPAVDCVCCCWCGELVATPASGQCWAHGDTTDCPPFDWEQAACAPVAIRELRRRNLGADLPPRAFAYAAGIAANLRDGCRWPSLVALVDAVWDRRIDWQ